MAEKYGNIPKRFTKDWFEYVWTYYKWHIIITIAVVVFVFVTVYQCTHRTQYDLTVYYAGNKIFTEKQVDDIEENIAAAVDDISGDGETLADFLQINFQRITGSEEIDYTLQTKLDLQFQTNKAFLFLFDKEEADLMLGRDRLDLTYTPVKEWATDAPSDDKLFVSDDGVAYGIYVGNNEKVKALGINTDDLYLVLRINNGDADDPGFANAVKFANYIIN